METDIRELGDRIASLNKSQAVQLGDYLRSKGINPGNALDRLFEIYPEGFPMVPGLKWS